MNQLLRSGLQQAAASVKPRPFRLKTKRIGPSSDWTSGSVAELIEMLEGTSASMMVLNANILLYAYDAESAQHRPARAFLEKIFSALTRSIG